MDETRERDNGGRVYHWSWKNEESKKELEMNENDAMEWNESIEMEITRSKCDWSGWEE